MADGTNVCGDAVEAGNEMCDLVEARDGEGLVSKGLRYVSEVL